MTADAKVGLLLGVLFIVIIAFLVNGFPAFVEKENPTAPPVTIPAPPMKDSILGHSITDAVHRLHPPRVEREQPGEMRVDGSVNQQSNDAVDGIGPVVFQSDQITQKTSEDVSPQVESVQPATPHIPAVPKKYHTAQSGQTLADIAKKFYGSEEGNRLVVVNKLYEANSKVLKSADLVRVGDKLVIPPLKELMDPSSDVVSAPSATERLMKAASDVLERVRPGQAPAGTEYVVQSGDNLWAIAQQTLGDGKRFVEIQKFNKNVISNANTLTEGMRIRIPPK